MLQLTKARKMDKVDQLTNIQCEFCDKHFISETKLFNHIVNTHKARKDAYQCSFCQKTFAKKQHLQMHESSVHTKENIYQCESCAKIFYEK